MKINYEILEGWDVLKPEKVKEFNLLKIFLPNNLPENNVLMPGDDIIIPTGLRFLGLGKQYTISPFFHTHPNKESDVLRKCNSRLDLPLLHLSIIFDNKQLFIHIINMGRTEFVYERKQIVYLQFMPLINLSEE